MSSIIKFSFNKIKQLFGRDKPSTSPTRRIQLWYNGKLCTFEIQEKDLQALGFYDPYSNFQIKFQEFIKGREDEFIR